MSKRECSNRALPLFIMKKLTIALTFSLLSSCANGKYMGPPITFTAGYEGVTFSAHVHGGKQPVEVQK